MTRGHLSDTSLHMPHNYARDAVLPPGTPCRGKKPACPASARPPDRLSIYYLQGRVPPGLFADRDCLGTWEEGEASFVFFSRPALERVQKRIEGRSGLSLVDHYQMSYAEWQGGRVARFSIGPLTVIPAWEAEALESDEGPILHDPGVVFGSGLHTTTRDCLLALTRVPPARIGRTVLDIGTGSGLLAIAAARLGWRRVVALDLNPLAVRTAQRNVRLNELQHRVLPVVSQAVPLPCGDPELIVANIHFDVMQELVQLSVFARCPAFILSGLLPSQMEVIKAGLRRSGRTVQETFSEDGTWQTCLGL